jgi:hypothetical protein
MRCTSRSRSGARSAGAGSAWISRTSPGASAPLVYLSTTLSAANFVRALPNGYGFAGGSVMIIPGNTRVEPVRRERLGAPADLHAACHAVRADWVQGHLVAHAVERKRRARPATRTPCPRRGTGSSWATSPCRGTAAYRRCNAMADFNATSFSTTQAQGADPGERAATSFSNTQSQAAFALPACNYISVVAFAPNRTFAGGAQQTYVMEARIVSTRRTMCDGSASTWPTIRPRWRSTRRAICLRSSRTSK